MAGRGRQTDSEIPAEHGARAVTILFNDFETRSRADIRKVGGRRYARDPSTRVLMNAYAFDDGPVEQWVPAERQKMPRDLIDGLRDPKVIKRSWNAAFELAIWEDVLEEEVFFDEWRCTMVHGMTLSFPGKLEHAGPIVDLPMDKLKDGRGKQLIRRFCQPRKPTKTMPWEWNTFDTHPEEWEEFKEYNRQDIVAERAIYRRIRKWDLPAHEWELWALDQEINRDGIPVNMRVVERAIEFTEYIRTKRYARMREITGIENPRSGPQLLDWLQAHGYRFDDLKAGHVKRAAEDPHMSKVCREVLTLRAEVARTSTDKYYAMERACDLNEDIIQGCLQFAGAQRTWRWSGRIIQPQNLSRPHPDFEKEQPDLVRALERMSNRELERTYDKPSGVYSSRAGAIDMLASAIRPTIQAPDGYLMISADLNAIENRVLGYLADDQRILDVFRKGRDPYIDFAGYMYDTDYETEWERFKPAEGEGKKDHRTIAKPGVLGCGYMLSAGEEHENKKTGEIEATGLLGYAWNMGVRQFTLEDAKLSVDVWRSTYQDAVKYWWEIEKAAKRTLRTGKESDAGPVYFDKSGPFMRMWLPSGRALHYCRPRLEEVELVWCEVKKKYLPVYLCKRPNYDKVKIKDSITYEGLDERNKWTRIQTHPGKLTENADQAISRDLLATGMRRFRRRVPRSEGKIRLHVHDEIVAVVREKEAERLLKVLIECMSEPMEWASEKELPLGAAGSIGKVWIKD